MEKEKDFLFPSPCLFFHPVLPILLFLPFPSMPALKDYLVVDLLSYIDVKMHLYMYHIIYCWQIKSFYFHQTDFLLQKTGAD